ncbi:MAG: hypothetical protein HY040_04410 [Planctomycetes bacterium]|nr:hypothetical protein [Planctomycetota bacterium]
MNPNQKDPVIDEVREIRRRISQRFDHDPARLVAYYIQMQEIYRDRMIQTGKEAKEKDQSAA